MQMTAIFNLVWLSEMSRQQYAAYITDINKMTSASRLRSFQPIQD